VIIAAGVLPALAAKAATTNIPIAFSVGVDHCAARACCEPRPGGITGSNGFIGEFGAKSLALLHELVPSAPV
jgi:hypothetical protein